MRSLAAAKLVLLAFSSVYEQLRPNHSHNKRLRLGNIILEDRTSNRICDNQCIVDAAGACGSFILAIAKDVVQLVAEGKEDAKRLRGMLMLTPPYWLALRNAGHRTQERRAFISPSRPTVMT
ncbi:hypothetical protein IG631_07382 [Alternaria alternata]|nr:hypothetical protein IG631_07382 [Alternaria alternata]